MSEDDLGGGMTLAEMAAYHQPEGSAQHPTAYKYDWRMKMFAYDDGGWVTIVGFNEPKEDQRNEYRNVEPLYVAPPSHSPAAVEPAQGKNVNAKDLLDIMNGYLTVHARRDATFEIRGTEKAAEAMLLVIAASRTPAECIDPIEDAHAELDKAGIPRTEDGAPWTAAARIEIFKIYTDNKKAALDEAMAEVDRLRAQVESASVRPRNFLAWAVGMFGPVAKLRSERLMRFIEEAIELAHADGMERATLDAIAGRVYGRERGEIRKEIGQAQACLETYAENIGESAAALAEIEWQRVQRIPSEEWQRRHAAKQAIGIALSHPSTVRTPGDGQ